MRCRLMFEVDSDYIDDLAKIKAAYSGNINIYLPTSNVEITNKSQKDLAAAAAGTPNKLGKIDALNIMHHPIAI